MRYHLHRYGDNQMKPIEKPLSKNTPKKSNFPRIKTNKVANSVALAVKPKANTEISVYLPKPPDQTFEAQKPEQVYFYFLSFGKIKKERGGVLAALKHNKRNLPHRSHIDSSLTIKNYDLHSKKPTNQINDHATAQMLKAGIKKPRSNQVLAVEIVFSLPEDWSKRKAKKFFADCYQWTSESFGVEILSFDVHLDQTAPHAHALLLPLIDGRMQGSALIGGKGKIAERHNSFYSQVASKHGLHKPLPKGGTKHEKLTMIQDVLRILKHDVVRTSTIWDWIVIHVHKDPFGCASQLNLKRKSLFF